MEQLRVQLEQEKEQLEIQLAAIGNGQDGNRAEILTRLISVLRQMEDMDLQAIAVFDQEIAIYDEELLDYDKYDRAKG